MKKEKKRKEEGKCCWTCHGLNYQKYLTDVGFLLSFGVLRVQKKSLNFEVRGDTSTPHRLHHYRRYFGGKHALGETPSSESTVFEITQNLWKQTLVFLWSFRSLPFLHNPLNGLRARLNRNSPFSSNYRLLVFLQAQLRLWIQTVIHRVFLTACSYYFQLS